MPETKKYLRGDPPTEGMIEEDPPVGETAGGDPAREGIKGKSYKLTVFKAVVFIFIFSLAFASSALAASTVFFAPLASTTDGSPQTWVNPGNGYVSDDAWATTDKTDKWVAYEDFNIPAIPAGSTINGIEVSVEGKTGGRQADVNLSWNAGSAYTSASTTNLLVTEGIVSLGGAGNTWGRTWATGDFTDANFRVKITSIGTGSSMISIDQVQVKVYYTAPAPPTAPVASSQAVTTNEDTAKDVTLSATDINGDTLTYSIVAVPSHGLLGVIAGNLVTYTPSLNYNGPDSFTFKANDGSFDSNTATVTITVNAVNDAPVANIDAYSTNEELLLTIPAPGVLGNDTDVEGDSITADLVTGVAHGQLALGADGSFTYTPDFDFTGSDSFTYRVFDGTEYGNNATTTITVDNTNDTPIANPDSYSAAEDTMLTVTTTGVLANDTDVDGDALTASLVDSAVHGAVVLNADGSFTYTPNLNYNGLDSFTYKANDGLVNSGVAVVTITVNAVDDSPTGANTAVSTNEDIPYIFGSADFGFSDVDSTSTLFAVKINTLPGKGTLSVDGTPAIINQVVSIADINAGKLIFTPVADENGAGYTSFTFSVEDSELLWSASPNTMTINVNSTNDAPVTVADAYTADEDTALTVSAPGVLANDTDLDGNTLTAVIVSSVTHGALVLNANGSFTYTPVGNWNGVDSFTYKANDGTTLGNIVTVSITVMDLPPQVVSAVAPNLTTVKITFNEELQNNATHYPSPLDFRIYRNSGIGAPEIVVTSTSYADKAVTLTLAQPINQGDEPVYKVLPAITTIIDLAGNQITTTTSGFVLDGLAPVAVISPASVAVKTEVSFDLNGSGSTDQFSGVKSYSWNFGDGSEHFTSSTPFVSHSYATAGSYTITLTVLDQVDNSVTASITAVITKESGTSESSSSGGNGGGGGSSSGGGGGSSGDLPTLSFNAPSAGFRVYINNDDSFTDSPQVILTMIGGQQAATMMISNSSDFTGASRENYSILKSWLLPGGWGSRIVYVRFFNSQGTASPVVSDTIEIVQPGSPQVLGVKISFLDELILATAYGTSGNKVSQLQAELKSRGFFPPGQKITGYYGPVTRASVNRYLNSLKKVLGVKIPTIDELIAWTTFGTRNATVSQLQTELKSHGFFPSGQRVTGYYGAITRASVRKYQASY